MARHHDVSLWLPFLLFISLIASTHQQEKCKTVADVGFILDSSFSLRNEYSDEKRFVKELASTLGITDYGNRASVVTFSSESKLSIKFNDHFMTEAFNRAVDGIPLMGQQTRIDKALRTVQKYMFSEVNGARPYVPHILILLTDGSQTYRSGAENPAIAAQELRDSGVILFVIGIGSDKLDTNEMKNIAGNDNNVFVAKDFKELITKEFVEKISGKTCSVAINGNWGEWSPYGECSANCGGGRQKRRRLCNNPSAANGGELCMLLDKSGRAKDEGQIRTCNEDPCSGQTPIDGNWNGWSDFTPCSASCGGGRKFRTRWCSDPYAEHGGKECLVLGSTDRRDVFERDEQDCNTNLCIVDGGWGEWSAYGGCSVTCGGGTRERSRECNSPQPENGGLDCERDDGKGRDYLERQFKVCGTADCAENGNWGEWAEFGPCDVTCGGGRQKRRRYCNNPTTSDGGLACLITGETTLRGVEEDEYRPCNKIQCPAAPAVVNGNWGDWSIYRDCSDTCGGGELERIRYCNNPPSQGGGLDCLLSDGSGLRRQDETAIETCNTQACPAVVNVVNGNWGDWSIARACSATCGGGELERIRYCNNPPSQGGGLDCVLSDGSGLRRKEETAIETCNTQACPVHANWGEWSNFDQCTVSCGGGKQSRIRLCDNPVSAHGGLNCLLLVTRGQDGGTNRGKVESETRDCNMEKCTVLSCEADVGCIIDPSIHTSSNKPSTNQTQGFIKSLVSSINASVITFTPNASINIKFNDYKNGSDFVTALNAIQSNRSIAITSNSTVDEALELAKTKMFSKENGARSGIPKILLVLTDGQKKSISVSDIAKTLWESGIHIVPIGVGDNVNVNELVKMAGKEGQFFIPTSFEELVNTNFIKNITSSTCTGKYWRPLNRSEEFVSNFRELI